MQEYLDYAALTIQPYWFAPLNRSDLVEAMTAWDGVPQAYTELVYGYWLATFTQHALNFATAQYRFHYALVENAFNRSYRIPQGDEPANYGLDEEWESMRQRTGLAAHLIEYSTEQERLTRERQRMRGQSMVTLVIQARTMGLRWTPAMLLEDLDEHWFRTKVATSAYDRRDRNDLPIVYQSSPRWQRLRAGLLVLTGARCQHAACMVAGESWFGIEREQPTLVPTRRGVEGQETLRDVALLCTDHLRDWGAARRRIGGDVVLAGNRSLGFTFSEEDVSN